MKIPVKSPASHVTQNKVCTTPIKDEIKFLYIKKEKLSKELYNIHLKAVREWGNTWYLILDSIHEPINQEMENKYKTS